MALWGNRLSLRPGVFAEMSNLRRLDLYLNQLTELPSGVFRGLLRLEHVDLGGNKLNLGPDIFANDLANLDYLSLYENQLTELPSGVFTGLSNLGRLDLSGNWLTGLSSGALVGLRRVRALWLQGNRGSPIPLTLQIERTDTNDLSAPGPATVVVTVDEGAPFDMEVTLSVPGATLSKKTVTIAAGARRSDSVTVTADTQGSVTLTLPDVPGIPRTHCQFSRRSEFGRTVSGGTTKCFEGFAITTDGPIRIFR